MNVNSRCLSIEEESHMSRTNQRLKRFAIALALAVVCAATYVATAPGRSLHAGPTWKQYTALKKQAATAKNEAEASLGILALCIMHKPVGVDQVGTSTNGYLYGPPQTAPNAVSASASSALNLAPSTEPSPQNKFYELNTSQPACVKLANLASTLSANQAVR